MYGNGTGLPGPSRRLGTLAGNPANQPSRHASPERPAPDSPGTGRDYREATFSIIATHLQAGQPVIAFVDTGELAYWSVTTNHAIVVIGLEAEHVVVQDPAFATTPQRIPFGEFEMAWLNCDNACAVVTVRRPT